ncbi:hydroxyethylthiazole kinase [Sinirhodobacter populi]|uniref:Hydroxyethylthiazole kinase n=1 Tax=Paenirhodobacter populi TaxID=2306993 RepID=A0A443K7V9_9RHOB|nr:hydroxyethylthiazole kinase [Sinirhodobacter populi]RWR28881.1 hydroxyethylthiazole kinase [Sinirhodobacter populi]
MEDTGHYLQRMRARAPLVQNITNNVAMNMMANVQIAAGASPAMADAAEEVVEFTALADALTVNIGTADSLKAMSMRLAGAAMNGHGRPWVFDPVGVGATQFRNDLCRDLLALCPTVVRGNASEILTLAGRGKGARGVDAVDSVASAEAAARELAGRTGHIVVATGPVDYVTDGTRALRVANGDPMMAKITVSGCSLNGVIAAFLVDQPPLEATAAALAYYGLAGERAAAVCAGPGTFQPAFLDALYALTPEDVTQGARIEAA